MSDAGNAYAAVLVDMRAKRAKLDEAISLMESMASEAGVSETMGAADIRSDTFFNLSVPQAVKKYLGMTGKVPKSPQDIMDALTRGGQTQATYTNVYTALKRSPNLQKVPSGEWGLSEWYGGVKKPAPKKGKAESAIDGADDAQES
ncbi:MAG: hypothetical protein ABIZ70_13695 [Gemmatimonadales bacterium]